MNENELKTIQYRINTLPKYLRERLPETEKAWKDFLFSNFEKALKGDDLTLTATVFDVLTSLLYMSVFSFSKEEASYIVKSLYNYICTSGDHLYVTHAVQAITKLFENYKMLDILLPWRPVYNILYKLFLSKSKLKTRNYPENYYVTMIKFSSLVSKYFSQESIQEIYDELKGPILNRSNLCGAALFILSSILPTHHNQHKIWFSDITDSWKILTGPSVDSVYIRLFLRLAAGGAQDVDWRPLVPLIFTKLARTLGVPPLPADINPPAKQIPSSFIPEETGMIEGIEDTELKAVQLFAGIIIELTKTEVGEEVRKRLEEVVDLVKPLHSPLYTEEKDCECDDSTHGSGFVSALLTYFCLKLKEDAHGVSLSPHLTREDREWFVRLLLPVYTIELYHVDNAAGDMINFAQILPEVVLPSILNTAQTLCEYQHMRLQAVRALVFAIPVASASGVLAKEYLEFAKQFVDDISPTDLDISSWTFMLYEAVGWAYNAEEYGEEWVLNLVKKCVEFSIPAGGDDYKESIDLMMVMLDAILYSAEFPSVYKYVEDSFELVPIESVDAVLTGFFSQSFADRIIKTVNEKNLAGLRMMAFNNYDFAVKNRDSLITFALDGLEHKEEKVRKAADRLIWELLHSATTPNTIKIKRRGYYKSDAPLEWREPSEADIAWAASTAERLIEYAEGLFRGDWQKQLIASKLIGLIVRGIGGSVKMSDLGDVVGDMPPMLPTSTSTALAKLVSRISEIALSHIDGSHHKVTAALIDALGECAIIRDDIAIEHDDMNDRYEEIKDGFKMRFLFDDDRSYSPNVRIWTGYKILGEWMYTNSCVFTTFGASITNKVMEYSTSLFDTIRKSVNDFMWRAIQAMVVSAVNMSKPLDGLFSNNGDIVATSAQVLEQIRGIADDTDSFPFIVDTALAVLHPTPADIPGDAFATLQGGIAEQLFCTNFATPAMSTPMIVAQRRRLIDGAVKAARDYPGHRETEIHAAMFLISAASTSPELLTKEAFEFLTSRIIMDDIIVRDFVIESYTFLVETLIPRIPYRPRDPSVQLTVENYDKYDFIDTDKVRKRPLKEMLFMTKEDVMSEAYQREHFGDGTENRAAICASLYSSFEDDEFIRKISNAFAYARDAETESFSFRSSTFWTTLIRFFGLPFALRLLKIADTLNSDMTNYPLVLSAWEIIVGVICAAPKLGTSFIAGIMPALFASFERAALRDDKIFWCYALLSSIGERDRKRLKFFLPLIDRLAKAQKKQVTKRAMLVSNATICYATICGVGDEDRLFELIEQLYDAKALSLDNARKCIMVCTRVVTMLIWREGRNDLAERLFYDYILAAPDEFISRWLLWMFSNQSFNSYSMFPLTANNLDAFIALLDEKDEEEHETVLQALLIFLHSPPLSYNDPLLPILFEQLDTSDRPWQTQAAVLTFAVPLVATCSFLAPDSVVADYIERSVEPALLSSSPPVQNAALELLTIFFKASRRARISLDERVSKYKSMLTDPATRIGGAKGLVAVVWSTLIFNEAPSYVVSAFDALASIADGTDPAGEAARDFFAEFWRLHDDNITGDAAEAFLRFRDAITPGYIT